MGNRSGYLAIFSSRAQKEIVKSWQWYEERQAGLGDRFLKEILVKIDVIEQNPESFPVRYKLYRETSIAVFPFLIIYKLNKRKSLFEYFLYFIHH